MLPAWVAMFAAIRRMIGVGATVLVAMSQVPPEQAIANLSAWAEKNGLPGFDQFARDQFFDFLLSNVAWIGIGLAFISFAPDLWRLTLRVPHSHGPVTSAELSPNGVSLSRGRRDLIQSARRLTSTLVATTDGQVDFGDKLETNPIYYRLRPHLSDNFKERMRLRGRTFYVPANERGSHPLAEWFLDEIDRIEQEWHLR